jgi:hypothetical protein
MSQAKGLNALEMLVIPADSRFVFFDIARAFKYMQHDILKAMERQEHLHR